MIPLTTIVSRDFAELARYFWAVRAEAACQWKRGPDTCLRVGGFGSGRLEIENQNNNDEYETTVKFDAGRPSRLP